MTGRISHGETVAGAACLGAWPTWWGEHISTRTACTLCGEPRLRPRPPHSPEEADTGDQEDQASAGPAQRPHVLPAHIF